MTPREVPKAIIAIVFTVALLIGWGFVTALHRNTKPEQIVQTETVATSTPDTVHVSSVYLQATCKTSDMVTSRPVGYLSSFSDTTEWVDDGIRVTFGVHGAGFLSQQTICFPHGTTNEVILSKIHMEAERVRKESDDWQAKIKKENEMEKALNEDLR